MVSRSSPEGTLNIHPSNHEIHSETVKIGTGHYMTLRRRQKDSGWKWVFDTSVPDPPPEKPLKD